jgi:hypothetical protein
MYQIINQKNKAIVIHYLLLAKNETSSKQGYQIGQFFTTLDTFGGSL